MLNWLLFFWNMTVGSNWPVMNKKWSNLVISWSKMVINFSKWEI